MSEESFQPADISVNDATSSIDNVHDTHDIPGKWIEELFQPTYKFTVDELLAGYPCLKEFDENGENPFAGLLFRKQISPVDVAAIKNVYQRVWMMMKLFAEAKQTNAQVATDPCKLY